MNVIIDRNRHTAIVLHHGRKLIHCVPLEEGELRVRAMRPEEYKDRGFYLLDYPIKRAVRKFLKHSGGVSKRARAALKTITKDAR